MVWRKFPLFKSDGIAEILRIIFSNNLCIYKKRKKYVRSTRFLWQVSAESIFFSPVEQYSSFFDRFTSNFRSMVVSKPRTGVKTGINGVNRNSVTSSCWFFFFFWNSISPNCWAGEKSYPNHFVLIKKIYPHFASLMRWHICFTKWKCRQNFM